MSAAPTDPRSSGTSLPAFSIRYPVTITMAVLAVVLLGWISLDRLGTDLLPNLRTPVVTVDLQAAGKSPQEMEERYTRNLERDLSTVDGVQRVYSVTRSGQSVVIAEFDWEADMDFGLLEVQKRAGVLATDDEVDTVDVVQQDPRALPVARIAVTSVAAADLDELLGTVETLVEPRLEALDGVAAAEIEGDAEKEVRVILNPYLLEAFGQTAAGVVQRIQAANVDVSGGTLDDGQQTYQVKGMSRLREIADLQGLIIGERQATTTAAAGGAAGGTGGNGAAAGSAGSGGITGATAGAGSSGATGVTGTTATTATATADRVPVRLGELARVELAWQERETIVRIDGVECLGLAIYKEADAGTVAVVETVMAALDEVGRDLPDVEFTVVENQARFIEQAVQEVEESALWGALLAVVVLLLFLRSFMVTLVTAIAIPISVLATFTLMYFQGLSLNVMTLGGLALGAGMLVDNAIVVIENIYRHTELGADPHTAASRGASQVGIAILASTLTTVSVFLPIVYVEGLVGELFKEQAWTVAFSLLSSLVVAMTLVPMMASRMLGRRRGPVGSVDRPRFRRALELALDHKLAVVVLVAGIVAATVAGAGTITTEFIPREDQGLLHVELALPRGTRLETTDRVASRAVEIVRAVGDEEVENVYARAGIDRTRVVNAGDPTGPNRATLSVLLRPGRRGRSLGELVEQIDVPLAQVPELEVSYRLHETALEGILGSEGAPIEVEVTGDDLDTLQRLTADLAGRMDALPAVYNVRTSFQGGEPEIDLALRVDVAGALGLTPETLIETVQRQLSGQVAGELSRDQRSRTIRVGFEPVDLEELRELRLEVASGGPLLTLGDVADPRVVEGPREILRDGQRRVGRVSAYVVEGEALGDAVAQVRGALADTILPVGYQAVIGGEERQRAESFGSLGFALALSVILVYMVMASLFESLLHPFTVMLTVPLAGIGVVGGLWATGEPLSVMAYIGVIMLGGIAVNGAIILVDRIQQLRDEVPSLREAVLQGAQDRLRPILMTSSTTILALGPMALGFGEGARLRAPMAIAVIGGLVTSTLLTLIVIPLVYEVIEKVRGLRRDLGDGGGAGGGSGGRSGGGAGGGGRGGPGGGARGGPGGSAGGAGGGDGAGQAGRSEGAASDPGSGAGGPDPAVAGSAPAP